MQLHRTHGYRGIMDAENVSSTYQKVEAGIALLMQVPNSNGEVGGRPGTCLLWERAVTTFGNWRT